LQATQSSSATAPGDNSVCRFRRFPQKESNMPLKSNTDVTEQYVRMTRAAALLQAESERLTREARRILNDTRTTAKKDYAGQTPDRAAGGN
jgi:hypothetical protein